MGDALVPITTARWDHALYFCFYYYCGNDYNDNNFMLLHDYTITMTIISIIIIIYIIILYCYYIIILLLYSIIILLLFLLL